MAKNSIKVSELAYGTRKCRDLYPSPSGGFQSDRDSPDRPSVSCKKIPAIAALAEKQEHAEKNIIFSDLFSQAPGSYSQAFSGAVKILIIPKSGHGNPLGSGSVGATVQQDFIEIIFSKGDILEVLRMTGPDSDYSILSSLAQKAYNKIP